MPRQKVTTIHGCIVEKVLSEEIRRQVCRELDPETIHAHPLEVRAIQAWAAPSAGHPQEAGSKGEDPEVEVMEGLPEVVSAAVDLVEAFGISPDLNPNLNHKRERNIRGERS